MLDHHRRRRRRVDAALVPQLLVLVLLILSPSTQPVSALIDPLSLAAVAGLGALGYTGWLRENTLCRVIECCNSHQIPADVQGNDDIQSYC